MLLIVLQEGHLACKNMGGWWRWALVSPDWVAPSRMVGVSASVNPPLLHKVQKLSSGAGSPGWSRKRAVKWLWYLAASRQPCPMCCCYILWRHIVISILALRAELLLRTWRLFWRLSSS